jgi:sensor histidine kinase regulating citrate/malate metabolism
MSWAELGILMIFGFVLIGLEVFTTQGAVSIGVLSDRTLSEILKFERPLMSSTALALGYACITAAIANAIKRVTRTLTGTRN